MFAATYSERHPLMFKLKKVTSNSIALQALAVLAISGSASFGSNAALAQDSGQSSYQAKAGAVFAMTNIAFRNEIVVFSRAANGTLTAVDRVQTGGSGKGDDFDTRGGLTLSDDHRFLYACNAGSNEISVFAVDGTRLTLIQKIFSEGVVPESLTLHGNLLYVLNGSVADNSITGFTVAGDGRLTPLSNSKQALSSPIAVPGDLQFSPDGRVLVATLKSAQVDVNPGPYVIDTFTVGQDGRPSAAIPQKSYGRRPFSTAFSNNGRLLVVDSGNPFPQEGAISTYNLNSTNGDLDVITQSEHNRQTDSCWVVLSKDQRYAYTSNFASGTVSSFRFRRNGNVELINGTAADLGATTEPTDIRISEDGRYFYVLLRGTGEVAAFRIENDGGLEPLGRVSGGLPANTGASGLAAY